MIYLIIHFRPEYGKDHARIGHPRPVHTGPNDSIKSIHILLQQNSIIRQCIIQQHGIQVDEHKG